MVIAIFTFYKDKLLYMSFDQHMHFFNKMVKSQLFADDKEFQGYEDILNKGGDKATIPEEYYFVKDFKEHASKIPITNELLKSLEGSLEGKPSNTLSKDSL